MQAQLSQCLSRSFGGVAHLEAILSITYQCLTPLGEQKTQQAGRYGLVGWLQAANTAIRFECADGRRPSEVVSIAPLY
jgi:hypothetical protein